MSGERIQVEPDDLIDTGKALRYVATEFDAAGDISEEYGEIVGHSGLKDKLEDFADNWDDKRAEMLEAINGLGEASEGIGSAFVDADNQLYDALMGKGE
ncbi:MAG: hypothetical protein ACRDO1_10175 [Nocardioidaceae bacterium]